MKKLVCALISVVLAFSVCVLSSEADEVQDYEAKLKDLNQQMKEAREDYKRKMQTVDRQIMEKMEDLEPGDRDARKDLLDQKWLQKKEIQEDYQKQVKTIRNRVKNLKAEHKGVIKSKKGRRPKGPKR